MEKHPSQNPEIKRRQALTLMKNTNKCLKNYIEILRTHAASAKTLKGAENYYKKIATLEKQHAKREEKIRKRESEQ